MVKRARMTIWLCMCLTNRLDRIPGKFYPGLLAQDLQQHQHPILGRGRQIDTFETGHHSIRNTQRLTGSIGIVWELLDAFLVIALSEVANKVTRDGSRELPESNQGGHTQGRPYWPPVIMLGIQTNKQVPWKHGPNDHFRPTQSPAPLSCNWQVGLESLALKVALGNALLARFAIHQIPVLSIALFHAQRTRLDSRVQSSSLLDGQFMQDLVGRGRGGTKLTDHHPGRYVG